MIIKNLEPANNIFLAPMAGITDLPFRLLAKEAGAGLVFSEMVSVKGILYNNENTKELLAISESEHPTAVQLFGHEPDEFAEAIKLIDHMPIDIYDLNSGCPAPKIVKSGDGCALMKDPVRIREIVSAMRKATDKPISVKIRAGFDENSINAVEVSKYTEDGGADMITVHGRTRDMYYGGSADLSIIRGVKDKVRIPVIGNGDVTDPVSAKKMLEETGCDGVMVGRAAQGNPWIFTRILHYLETGELIPEPEIAEKIDLALRHFKMLIDYKGEYTAVREMRRHLPMYVKGIKNSAKIRAELVKAESFGEMEKTLLSIHN